MPDPALTRPGFAHLQPLFFAALGADFEVVSVLALSVVELDGDVAGDDVAAREGEAERFRSLVVDRGTHRSRRRFDFGGGHGRGVGEEGRWDADRGRLRRRIAGPVVRGADDLPRAAVALHVPDHPPRVSLPGAVRRRGAIAAGRIDLRSQGEA